MKLSITEVATMTRVARGRLAGPLAVAVVLCGTVSVPWR
jgi:hypothetical protein